MTYDPSRAEHYRLLEQNRKIALSNLRFFRFSKDEADLILRDARTTGEEYVTGRDAGHTKLSVTYTPDDWYTVSRANPLPSEA